MVVEERLNAGASRDRGRDDGSDCRIPDRKQRIIVVGSHPLQVAGADIQAINDSVDIRGESRRTAMLWIADCRMIDIVSRLDGTERVISIVRPAGIGEETHM